MKVRVLLTVAALIVLAGCTDDPPPPPVDPNPAYVADPKTINLVAGSEQQSVLDTIVKPWCQSKGYTCTVTLKGSVDQARLLASSNTNYDAYWFASTVFQQLGDAGSKLRDVKPMFLTPVVYAGWRSEMQKLGFVGKPDVGIGDILKAVESGTTTVWVTNPTQSNSGATVLLAFMNYFAGNGPGEALTQQQLDSPKVEEAIKRFIASMAQTPPSTGVLMTECLARPDACRTLFTYEDLVIEKNQELVRAGKEPLVAVYPRGSLAISDAPLGFLPHGNEFDDPKRGIVTELQQYLLTSPEARAKLLGLGRRPAGSIGLTLDNPDPAVFNPDWGIQATIKEQGMSYPSTTVISAALDRYQTRYRRPVNVYYCLDGSGSMVGNRGWEGIEAAARQLFDQDQAAVNLLQTHPKDRTTVAIFNSDLTAGSPWSVDGNDPGQMHSLTERVVAYDAEGGTDMYSCLKRAADELRAPQPDDRKRLVIVMSDGQSEGDRGPAVAALKEVGAPVIAIAFGDETDVGQLKEVASATGGAFFQQGDLVAALRQAAGYK